jgi:2,4-dienoyl-CoA reductase-like NADH-dependent reductase (Old Yellow Enzyme family)
MDNDGRFKKFFEPSTIGQLRTKNRFARPAAGTDFVDAEGILQGNTDMHGNINTTDIVTMICPKCAYPGVAG